MKSSSSLLGHAACFVAYAIFGVNIVTCKDLTSSHMISPLALFSMRSVCAASLFWIISMFMPREKVHKGDYIKIFAASILGFFLTQITFLVAIPDITPMDCSIVSALSPIYTMLIAAVAVKEPVTWRKACGVTISLVGVLYLIINSVTGGGVASTSLKGIVLIVLNSLCFSLYLGIFRPVIKRYSVVTFMKWIFLFSTLLSLPVSIGEIVSINYSALTPGLISELAFLIICATFVSYLLIPIAQQRIRPTLVSMYSYVQPIVAIAISIAVGMDSLSWQKVLAACTVFGGVVIVSYSREASHKH